jgi:hypothetical protein
MKAVLSSTEDFTLQPTTGTPEASKILLVHFNVITKWPLGSQIMLIYTTDGTIESNTEHFTRIQEVFFPFNSVLTQLVLQAYSPNASIEHSASLTGTLTHLSNTLQYTDTIPLCSVFQLHCFTIANTLLASRHKIAFSSTCQSYLMPIARLERSHTARES